MARSSKPQKTATKKPVRKLQASPYRTLRLSKRIKHPNKPLPSAYKIFKASIKQLIKNWKLFGGITLVYLILSIILVKGFGSNNNIAQLKSTLQSAFGGSAANAKATLTLFGALLSNVGSTDNSLASTYQTILLLIISLVLIWALRHTTTGKKQIPTIRDAFYKSPYPLIPFILVLIVIELQFIPVLVANFISNTVIAGGLAVTSVEKVLWILLCLILVILSLYMVTSSLFALYIVTLPDLRPMKALRSARELVRYRRLMVLRKILFLPVALLIVAAVITVPLIMFAPALAQWVFFGLSMLALAVFHSYLYNLYRALL
jgi:hypothetical protein